MKEPVHSSALMIDRIKPTAPVILAGSKLRATLLSATVQSRVPIVVLFLLMVCSFSQAVAATDLQAAWKKGNAFYQQKEYDSAAYYFEQIAATKPGDATVFYNLGNTYYRLNNIGYAVLNYERALKRKPDYKEAADNLLLTQSRIPGLIQPAQDIFFITWWKAWTAPGTITAWSVASLLLFLGLIGLLLYKRLRSGVYIRPQYIGALSVLWLLALLMAFAASSSLTATIRGVILSDNVTMNSKASKVPVSLPEGTSVKVRSTNAAAYEVELADNRTGLVPKELLQLVD